MGICLCSRTDYRICIARLDFSYYVDRFCALQCDTLILVQYLQLNTSSFHVCLLCECLHCNSQNRRLNIDLQGLFLLKYHSV